MKEVYANNRTQDSAGLDCYPETKIDAIISHTCYLLCMPTLKIIDHYSSTPGFVIHFDHMWGHSVKNIVPAGLIVHLQMVLILIEAFHIVTLLEPQPEYKHKK